MNRHEDFDPHSPEQCAELFGMIREVYPHLNDGLLQSALTAAREEPKRDWVHWALKLAEIANGGAH